MSAGGDKIQRRWKATVRYESLETVTVDGGTWTVGRQDFGPFASLTARVMKARP